MFQFLRGRMRSCTSSNKIFKWFKRCARRLVERESDFIVDTPCHTRQVYVPHNVMRYDSYSMSHTVWLTSGKVYHRYIHQVIEPSTISSTDELRTISKTIYIHRLNSRKKFSSQLRQAEFVDFSSWNTLYAKCKATTTKKEAYQKVWGSFFSFWDNRKQIKIVE